MIDLLDDFEDFSNKFTILANDHIRKFPNLEVDIDTELSRYKVLAERVRPMVVETVSFLHDRLSKGDKVLVEGANAAMLDIDFGKRLEISKLEGRECLI